MASISYLCYTGTCFHFDLLAPLVSDVQVEHTKQILHRDGV